MKRPPDWAGTEPASVKEFLRRLPARTQKMIAPLAIDSLDAAHELRSDMAKGILNYGKSHIPGLGRAALRDIELALGFYYPDWSSLCTDYCCICNGKRDMMGQYCDRHASELESMRGSWLNFIYPKRKKGFERQKWQAQITSKAVRRWLRKRSPTIINEKDAEKWRARFHDMIDKNEHKRSFYRMWATPEIFFYEGSQHKTGHIWVDGELIKILPAAALPAMNQMKRVADRMERVTC